MGKMVVCLAVIYAISGILFFHLGISSDVGWLLVASKRMLQGLHYADAYFETTPPLILYLYAPVILAAKILPVRIDILFAIYIYLLTSVVLWLTWHYSTFLKPSARKLFLLLTAAAFLCLPMHNLGQREHLFVLFAFPYFLVAISRFSFRPINPLMAMLIGILAALGFGIKPYFALTWLILEAVIITQRKSIFSLLRPECICVFIGLTFYYGLIFICYSDYLTVILPFAFQYYHQSVGYSFSILLQIPPAPFLLFPVLSSLIILPFTKYKLFNKYLLGALLSVFVCVYLLQHTIFFYHILPAYLLGIILLYFNLYEIVTLSSTHRILDYGRFFLGFVALLFLATNASDLLMAIQLYPYFFLSVAIVLLVGLIYVRLSISNSLLIILLVTYPCYFAALSYFGWANNNQMVKSLQAQFFQQDNGKRVFLLSEDYTLIFPDLLYTKMKYASRFPFFWMLPAIVKTETQIPSESAKLAKTRLTYYICEDLLEKQPEVLYIDVAPGRPFFRHFKFDPIAYFSQEACFANILKHYQFVETLVVPNSESMRYQRYVKSH